MKLMIVGVQIMKEQREGSFLKELYTNRVICNLFNHQIV